MRWSHRAAITLAAALGLGAVLGTPAQAHETEGYSHESGTDATNPDWMRRLPDQVRFSELSIPGTHDSGAYRAGGDGVVTQTMNLRTQLEAGIRAWDIRLEPDGDGLTVYHGISRQGQDFDTEVLAVADEFLQLHPYETVFMRVKDENDGDAGFDDLVASALGRHPRVYTGTDDNPAVGDIRGKIVVLQNFSSDTDFGIRWGALSIQDNYTMTDQWQMARKWRDIRGQLDTATNGDRNTGFVNFLSAAGTGVFPYFVASGHTIPATGGPNRVTGMTRGVIDTCSGNSQCLDEYRSVDCFLGTCSVAFEGTNVLTMNEIYARPWRARYGIVYADFPGRGLIHAVYNSNNFHGVFRGKQSGRCVVAPSPADGTQVRLADCTGDASQTWLAASADQFKLLNTTKCLDVRNAGPADGTAVQSYECNGTPAQKWFVDLTGQVVNFGTGKCLTPLGDGTGNGTQLVIRSCQNSVSQAWSRR
ncbi:ricin-type beta-trefoil lectin domain protein [Lentzea sp. NPDC060358]|uniref:ricin-type beta-trefoil lectin domain protein n=1 Tax=Lentzea sp. NPDC060358 TaxID=3347103 RepID=UPI00365F8F5B